MTLGDRCDEIVRLIDEALVLPGGPTGGRAPLPPTGGRAPLPIPPHPGRGDTMPALDRRSVTAASRGPYRPGPAHCAG